MLNSVSTRDTVFSALSVILICLKADINSVAGTEIQDYNSDVTSANGSTIRNNREILEEQRIAPTAEISEPVDRKVICYYDSEASRRKRKAKFLPEDINVELCTHINYCFAVLNQNSYLMVPKNPDIDIKENFYTRVVDLKKKNPKLKVLLTLGGREDSKRNPKYSFLVASSSRRKLFVQETVALLKEYNFDGLDLDWEYPSSPSYGIRHMFIVDFGVNDKKNFVLLVKELREAFDKAKPPLLLTALVSPEEHIVTESYEIPDLAKYVDFFNVMPFILHGPQPITTGYHSTMYAESLPQGKNVDHYMRYLLEKGASKQKLMLGVPFFSYSFTLRDSKNNGLLAPVLGEGKPGYFTETKGILSYFEMCDFIKNDNWVVVRDSGVCPYAYKDDQWVGFSDLECAREKSYYAMIHSYGGVMVFDITMDDFKGTCSKETYPLLRAVNSQLGFKEGKTYTAASFTNESECN